MEFGNIESNSLFLVYTGSVLWIRVLFPYRLALADTRGIGGNY